jgi:arsenical pump membrane protein
MVDYLPAVSVSVFALTLFLMIKRPKGINLGLAAGIGAVLSLLLGTVTVYDALQSFVDIWDAALAFVGIVALSVTLDAMGFFKWAALKVVKLSRGNGVRLYVYVTLLTAAVSVLFANDSAVLILTPIVLEVVSQLKIDANGRMAYLFSAGLIADTAAMPLITSNPVNILSADFFHYSFVDHLVFMGPVAVVTIMSSFVIVYLFFRKKIPKACSVELIDALTTTSQPLSPSLLKISIATLVAIDVGYVFASLSRLPVSLVICTGALFLIIVYWFTLKNGSVIKEERKGLRALAKEINWGILLFMVSIFLVVQGLRHSGAIDFLANAFLSASALPSVLSVLAPSLIVTVGASFMNNWPMTFLGLLSIKQVGTVAGIGTSGLTGLIFSNIIGNNLGPHFFPLGSLAILMWLDTMRRKGVKISFKDYLKVGSVLSIAEVAIASAILWLELSVLGFRL